MSLPESECDNLREGDVVLVQMFVERTNNHFAPNHGMKIVCRSTEVDHRSREDREKGPRLLDIMSRHVHSVLRRPIRVGDWVAWESNALHHQGKVTFLTNNEEAVVRRRRSVDGLPLSVVLWMDDLTRVLPPTDLNDIEKAD